MSRTYGGSSPAGAATLHGFVPSSATAPPGGRAIRCRPQFDASSPIIPRPVTRAAWWPAQPKWVARRTDTSPIPCRSARSAASSIAAPACHSPSAPAASTSTAAPRSATTSGSASGSARPSASSGR